MLARIWEANRTRDDPAKAAALWAERRRIARLGGERAVAFYGPLAAVRTGRFLDIGCGLGSTVRAFADAGWDALGVDADPATKPVHEEFGIASRIGQVETLDLEGGWDIVHSAHAIYFVTDPMAFLARARSVLRPDGLLAITIADVMAWDDSTEPAYVHTFFPTGQSMAYAITLAGFRVVATRRAKGSIHIAACIGAAPMPPVSPWMIRLGHVSRPLRYALVGRPMTILRRLAKKAIGRG
ncbi:class I SAM-dependent methyltransferase [Elioraea rosea]|uniref:class I SAM-dependent methyltransferase n=1 Tax=Elioraea rosea TaxID=2492390 RepID=UPI0013158C87|nr:class I SAM-dependent methyltransferase [Elioraea rosea]